MRSHGVIDTLEVPGGEALDKAVGIVGALPDDVWMGVVVDVGCRRCELEKPVEDARGTYFGVDLSPTGDLIADLGAGLPLRTGSADTVVALDVLEHTDDIHHAFTELCRVASRHVVITLPNMYDWKTRIRYLRGRQLGAKYGLPVDPPGDRHRWFFGLDEARAFCRANGSRAGWRIIDERVLVGPRSQSALGRRLATRLPSWFCSTYLAVLVPA
jgi:hypothetical protein